MRLLQGALLASMVVLCAPHTARADPFHHQTVPLGERALGMGGAFTGVADDPSAVFYNPAGLSQLEDTALSASLTLNAFDQRVIKRGYRTTEGETDLRHTSQPTLPLFVSLVKQVGRRQPDGSRRHAIALSTVTVDQRRLRFDTEITTPPSVIARGEDAVFDTFKVDTEESTVWHGFSYSYRLRDTFSLGFSGFLSLHRMKYDEELLNVTVGAVNPALGSFENRTTNITMRNTSVDVKNLVGRIGALYVHDTEIGAFRYGLMFQPPSIKLSGNGKVHQRIVQTDFVADPPYGTYYDASDSGLSASRPEPWELRLGASYAPDESFLVAVDTSLYGAVGTSNNLGIPGLGSRELITAISDAKPDEVTGLPPSAGELFIRQWRSKMIVNGSIGFESRIRDVVALRGGVFTDLSAAPKIKRTSGTVAPADINRFGAALSVGLLTGGYNLSVGAAGLLGSGTSQAYTLVGEELFERTRVTDRTVFVFISGAKNAVTRLAKSAYRKLRERRESQKNVDVQQGPGPSVTPGEPTTVESVEEVKP